MAVTIEQASQNALGAWLAARLPDVPVSFRWPDPEVGLPAKEITILRAGPRVDELTQAEIDGQADIHAAISARVTTALATDTATAITLLNALRGSYEVHRVDVTAHQAADAVNALTAPAASDLTTALALANDLRAKVNAHEASTVPHTNADTKSPLTTPIATDAASLVTLSNVLRQSLNAHYVARIYRWRLRCSTQPFQLDVWSTYDAVRDDILARLDQALNVSPVESAGFATGDIGNGVAVQLGDGWTGVADFLFDAPMLNDAPDAELKREFRATIKGRADFMVTVNAQSARLATIALRQTLAPPTSTVATTTTIAWSAAAPGYTTTTTE